MCLNLVKIRVQDGKICFDKNLQVNQVGSLSRARHSFMILCRRNKIRFQLTASWEKKNQENLITRVNVPRLLGEENSSLRK